MPNIARHFARTQLKDIELSAQVVGEVGTPVRDVVMAMANADTSCAFVMDGPKITGILTEHDVTHRVVQSPDVWDQPVDSFMTPNPHVVDKEASAMEALHIMRVNRIRNLPVVLGEAGQYANVTHYDLIVLASRYLEQQPGEGHTLSAEHVLRYVDFYGMHSKIPIEVTEDTSLAEVIELMVSRERGLISIVDDRGVVIGEFTQHDLFGKVACRVEDLEDERVGDWMTTSIASSLPSVTIAKGLQIMAEKRHRYLVLLNETGRSIGIVTFRDISEYFEAAFTVRPETAAEA